jgi:hypothetical protein
MSRILPHTSYSYARVSDRTPRLPHRTPGPCALVKATGRAWAATDATGVSAAAAPYGVNLIVMTSPSRMT